MEFEDIKDDWKIIFNDIISNDPEKSFQKLQKYLDDEYAKEIIYPPRKDIFNAFRLTSYADTKVVILGQDPYPKPNEAHGLAFSVQRNVQLTRSLNKIVSLWNIYNEIDSEFSEGCCDRQDGCLERWANHGVLLLNTVLTVRKGEPESHLEKNVCKIIGKKQGWERFTDAIIKKLCEKKNPVIFMLWGEEAQKKERLISVPSDFIFKWPQHVPSEFVHKLSYPISHHIILKAPHPAFYYRFKGCGHFKITNDILEKNGIDWQKNQID